MPTQSTPQFVPDDPAFEARVRESFARQRFMAFLGARLVSVAPGRVEIEVTRRDELTQQHGFIHAGVTGSIIDSACGYAAYTLMPAGHSVLTVEYKLNLLNPAEGGKLIARAVVERAGKSIYVCRGEVFAVADGVEKICAVTLATVMALPGRSDGPREK